MVLFMAFYFSRYFPTEDLLIVASFFLASFGLWKVFDYLDSKIDTLVKRLEEKKTVREKNHYLKVEPLRIARFYPDFLFHNSPK